MRDFIPLDPAQRAAVDHGRVVVDDEIDTLLLKADKVERSPANYTDPDGYVRELRRDADALRALLEDHSRLRDLPVPLASFLRSAGAVQP